MQNPSFIRVAVKRLPRGFLYRPFGGRSSCCREEIDRQCLRVFQHGHADLNAKQALLVEPIGRHPNHESNADVPDRKSRRDDQYEALTLVLRHIASPEGELGSRQEQDDAENGRREEAQQRGDRTAEENSYCKQHQAKNDKRAPGACTKLHVTGHAAGAVAHRHAADAQEVQRLYDAMKAEAIATGEQLIDAEAALDRAFKDRTIAVERLAEMSGAIGSHQSALRTVHLKYHLTTAELLTADQCRRYAELRGYR
jgi:hypothetical protein